MVTHRTHRPRPCPQLGTYNSFTGRPDHGEYFRGWNTPFIGARSSVTLSPLDPRVCDRARSYNRRWRVLRAYKQGLLVPTPTN